MAERLLLITKYPCTAGVYNRVEDHCGFPAWLHESGERGVYKLYGKQWAVAPEIGAASTYWVAEDTVAESPVGLDWGQDLKIELPPDTSGAPERLLVGTRYATTAGVYIRSGDHCGFPAWVHENGQRGVYKLCGQHWALAEAVGNTATYFTVQDTPSVSPAGLDWGADLAVDIPPDNSSAPDRLLLLTKYSTTAGIYRRHEDYCGFPAWLHENGQRGVYKLCGQHWAVAPQIGDTSTYFTVQHSSARTPVGLDWGEDLEVRLPPDASDAPARLLLLTNFQDAAGAYNRHGEHCGFPAWLHPSGTWAVYKFCGMHWVVSQELGSSSSVWLVRDAQETSPVGLEWGESLRIEVAPDTSQAPHQLLLLTKYSTTAGLYERCEDYCGFPAWRHKNGERAVYKLLGQHWAVAAEVGNTSTYFSVKDSPEPYPVGLDFGPELEIERPPDTEAAPDRLLILTRYAASAGVYERVEDHCGFPAWLHESGQRAVYKLLGQHWAIAEEIGNVKSFWAVRDTPATSPLGLEWDAEVVVKVPTPVSAEPASAVADAPKGLLLKSDDDAATGVYRRGEDHCGFPTWVHVAGLRALYKILGRHWVLGAQVGSPTTWSVVPDTLAASPLDVDWGSSLAIELEPPPLEASSVPDGLRVMTSYPSTTGYYKRDDDHCGFPAWVHANGQSAIYKLFGKHWALAPELGATSTYNTVQDSPAPIPVGLDWGAELEIQLPDTSDAATRLLLLTKYSSTAGVYSRVEDHCGFPAWLHESGQRGVYKLCGQHWAVAPEIGASKPYFAVANSPSTMPVELDWGEELVVRLPPDTSEVPERLLALSKYECTAGVYQRHADHCGFPAWLHINGERAVYKLCGTHWALAPELGNSSPYFVVQDAPATSPVGLQWGEELEIQAAPDNSKAPQRLLVVTKYATTAGVYERVEDHCGYPAWRHQNGQRGVYKLLGQHWALAEEVGNKATYFVVADSPELTPVGLDFGPDLEVKLPPNTDAVPDRLVLFCKFAATAGFYNRVEDHCAYPVWQHENGERAVYKLLGQHWAISKQVGDTAAFFTVTNTEAANPSVLDWGTDVVVADGAPAPMAPPAALTDVPEGLCLRSDDVAASGIYKRGVDHCGFPTWAHLNGHRALYKFFGRHWVVGAEIGSPVAWFVVLDSPATSPVEADWRSGLQVDLEAPPVDNSGAPEGLIVVTKYTSAAGFYKRGEEHCGFPTWLHSSGKRAIFKMFGAHWAIGNEVGAQTAFFIVQNSAAVSPLGIDWGSDLTVEEAPDTSNAPEGLLLVSKYALSAGVYKRVEDYSGFPAWRREAGQRALYKLFGRHWAIGGDIGDFTTFFVVKDTAAANPMDVDWGADLEMLVDPPPPDTSAVPNRIYLNSVWNNVHGGYVRRAEDYERYPVYVQDGGGLILHHKLGLRSWIITDVLGSASTFNSCVTDEVDVTKLSTPELWRKPEGIEAIEEIAWSIEEVGAGSGFVDEEFPPRPESIGGKWNGEEEAGGDVDGNATGEAADDGIEVAWIRMQHLNRDLPIALFSEIHPNDCNQGGLGDCWLISAIACVAEFPSAIERLFERSDVSEEGRYAIELYDVRCSAWVKIVLDDLIPCMPRKWWQRDAVPLFGDYNSGNDTWMLLLEKAFAKFVGSYYALKGGSTSWAWQALCGEEAQVGYWKNEDSGGWAKWVVDANKQREDIANGDRRACPWVGNVNEATLSDDELFSNLREWDERNYLMGAGIDSAEGEVTQDNGIVMGHAYSVMAVKKVDQTRIVQLRNPWGSGEWKGAWSDGSPEWTQHLEVAEAVGYKGGDLDGSFWMSATDFMQTFTSIKVQFKSMESKRCSHKVCKKNKTDVRRNNATRILLPGSRQVEQGALLLSDLATDRDFELSFDVTPHSLVPKLSNILRITGSDQNLGGPFDCMPGFWFKAGSTRLHCIMGCHGDHKAFRSSKAELPLGETSRVTARLQGDSFAVKVNGSEACAIRGMKEKYKAKTAIKVWLGDNFNPAADATVGAVVYRSLGSEGKSRRGPLCVKADTEDLPEDVKTFEFQLEYASDWMEQFQQSLRQYFAEAGMHESRFTPSTLFDVQVESAEGFILEDDDPSEQHFPLTVRYAAGSNSIVPPFLKCLRAQLEHQSVAETFEAWDADSNQKISCAELTVVLRKLNAGFTDNHIKQLLANIDTDGSNDIGYEELLNWIFTA